LDIVAKPLTGISRLSFVNRFSPTIPLAHRPLQKAYFFIVTQRQVFYRKSPLLRQAFSQVDNTNAMIRCLFRSPWRWKNVDINQGFHRS